MNQVLAYLSENFGLLSKADPLSQKKKTVLPLYLKGNFELYDGYILETPVIWAKPLENNDLNPIQLKKQENGLKNSLNSPIIFVFDHLDAWQRKRLIDKHIGFVQPFKQLYIPELFLEFNDTIAKKNSPIAQGSHLKPLSQLALLYHLEVASLANRPFGEIAQLLHLSTMSITRIVKELQSFRLIEVKGKKEKTLSFPHDGKLIWEKSLPFLRSPVRQTGFISKELPQSEFRIGGEPALARYTLLAGNEQPSYCIGKEAFLALRRADKLPSLADKYGDHKIEVWHYDPTLLSQKEEVDSLSLYLTLAKEKDERVTGALNDLINEMQWLKD
jgi:hypothetical protein